MKYNEIFFPELQSSGYLSVNIAGITLPDPRYRIIRNVAKFYVLEYILSGSGIVVTGGTSQELHAGDSYFLQPGEAHEYRSSPGDPWTKLWINFHGPLADGLCDGFRLRGKHIFRNVNLEKEFRQLHDLRHQPAAEVSRQLPQQLFFMLQKLSSVQFDSVPNRGSKLTSTLQEFIESHLDTQLTLPYLASRAALSVSQCSRIFRQQTGMSIYAYIQQRRELRSRQYLENTMHPVAVIAGLTGFKDEFYFSNWFHRRTGLSPGQYRRQFRIK